MAGRCRAGALPGESEGRAVAEATAPGLLIGMMKQLSGMDGSAGKSYQAVAEAGTATIQGAPAYPTTMVLAVLVDAAVDGFLIGISAASGTNAGLIMATV